ncbi:BadF/BadG/BcrA/BcrD ATPase family protein [Caldivirga maquilingensis]|uniref:ATPase BadF/BadG/BcrA/BcrD type n=1 Tax=Caldivirga maquilingensis (strain ATCC 700844 / DSM 13496 / JCM 10307 / IC-167) TaxID=397948 RepID=A8MD10_CALMQ|nr:BadF/BadG/BcrA/BcrD ATPase family protein [Caldivirga maquilingensis]ABW01666.1 ATPase BadF/BadG/BcrA/BcrD type [Caldivirga maquilingensis IC-167]
MVIIALDSGKTKTNAVAIDDSLNVLCRVSDRGGGLIYSDEVIMNALMNVIVECMRVMGIRVNDIDVIAVSWADLDTEAYWIKASRIINELARRINIPRSKLVFDHDAVAAYYAVTLGEPGVAVIAGTGAIALGVNARGERARSSGWGWLIGDEGSAGWIALKALNAASRAYDGRGPWTSLVNRLKDYFKVKDLLSILDVMYAEPPEIDKLAKLAILVSEEAEGGDEVSVNILKEAGRELALNAVTVAKRLGMINESIVVGGVGSVFSSRIVNEEFRKVISNSLVKAKVKEPLIGNYSLLGPIIMSLSRINKKITNTDVEKLLKEL